MTDKPAQKNRSLMFRTWLYFVGMTLILLTVLWTTEVIFFKAYYQRMKEYQLRDVCSEVVKRFTGIIDPAFVDYSETAVSTNSLMMVAFTIDEDVAFSEAEEDDIKVLLYCDPLRYAPDEGEMAIPGSFLPEQEYFSLAASTDPGTSFFYRVRREGREAYTLIMGCNRITTSGMVYFYFATAMPPMDITAALLTNQLVLVTCFCVIVSVLLSYAFSKNITRPIRQFALSAKLLGKGGKARFKTVGCREFDELADALNYSSAELEKTEKMRRDFLANVSHDLRTPLTMVKAYAEMIRDISGKDEKKRTEHCRVIIDEVDRLTLLVNDILDLSKIQSGTREPILTRVNLSTLVENLMERFAILEQSGYSFEVTLGDDCFVECDERMVEQIFYNLISNAVSYTGADKKVSVIVKRDGKRVRAEIKDTGKGIAPSEREKVWDRYYRASQAKRAVVGSGIGLSIVKSLLELHHAEYGVDSVVNNGSSFWFSLPYFADEAEE